MKANRLEAISRSWKFRLCPVKPSGARNRQAPDSRAAGFHRYERTMLRFHQNLAECRDYMSSEMLLADIALADLYDAWSVTVSDCEDGAKIEIKRDQH